MITMTTGEVHLDTAGVACFLHAQALVLQEGLDSPCEPQLGRMTAAHENAHDLWLTLYAHVTDPDVSAALVELYALHGRIVEALQRDPLVLCGADDLCRILAERLEVRTAETVALLEGLSH